MQMTTGGGGHVGWIEGDLWNMKQWFPKPTMEFLSYYIEEKGK